jgi:membrane-associated phospholipid phosphatase
MPTFNPSTRFWLYCSGLSGLTFAMTAALYAFSGTFQRFDYWIGNGIHTVADMVSYRMLSLMAVISFFGGQGAIIIAVLVFGYLLVRRSWAELLLWSGTIGGMLVLNRLLKSIFEMTRPVVGHMDLLEVSDGFPSGHAMAAIVTYGLLAYLIAQRSELRSFHLVSWVSAGFIALSVGFSRLYLTVHHFSDVVGGWFVGLAWMSLCIWLYQARLDKRDARIPSAGATGRQAPSQD